MQVNKWDMNIRKFSKSLPITFHSNVLEKQKCHGTEEISLWTESWVDNRKQSIEFYRFFYHEKNAQVEFSTLGPIILIVFNNL